MYYHGSPIGNLKKLNPQVSFFSEDDKAFVYLTTDKAHAAIYTVKSYMYPYGFNRDTGIVSYHEPYDGFLTETYLGKSGYVYGIEDVESIQSHKGIRYAHYTSESVSVTSVEFIEDVYLKLSEYDERGKIELIPYDRVPDKTRQRYHNWVVRELATDKYFSSTEDYPMFLKEKFPAAWKEANSLRTEKKVESN